MDTKTATDAELRAVLLTCDGKGKAVKEAALTELLNRRFPAGVKDMAADAYLPERD